MPGYGETSVENYAALLAVETRKFRYDHIPYSLKPIDADVTQRKPKQDKKNDSAKRCSTFKKLLRKARDIYRAGPPGEGQELWTSLRSYRRAKQTVFIFKMFPTKRTDGAIRVPSRDSTVESMVTDQLLGCSPVMIYVPPEDVDQVRSRQDSVISCDDISRTSREVPIKIRRTFLNMDTSKLLPPSPPLNGTPKSCRRGVQGKTLNLDKALPRTPLPCSSEISKPHQEAMVESLIDPSWLPNHVQIVGPESLFHQNKTSWQSNSTYQEQSKHSSQGTQHTTRLKDLSKNILDTHLHFSSKSHSNKAAMKAHSALRAEISGPVLIEPTVNISLSRAPVHPGAMGEDAICKQKTLFSPTWLNKLVHPVMPTLPTLPTMHKAKKRPASGESFACQGLGKGHVLDAGPSLHDDGLKMKVESV